MADHSIRIGIDSSEAKRGAVEVTNSLKSIQDAATKAVGRGKGIAVGIDSSGADAGARRVKASLREIQDQASRLASKPISVKLDAVGMDDAVAKVSRTLREISQKAGGAGASVSMRASVDSSGVDAGAAKVRKTIRDLQAEASKVAGSGKGIAVGIDASGAEAGAARVNRSLRDIITQAAKVSSIPVRIDATGAQAATGRMAGSLKDIRKQAEDSAGGMGLMSAAAMGAQNALGGIAAAYGGVELAKAIKDTTAQFQDLETRFTTLTGSAESARETMQYLSDTSNKLSVDTLALADSYSKLLPMVKDGTLSTQQARDMMTGLVDAQKATGASTAQLEQAMFGLAQTLGMPKANIEQLNQVTEPMPGLLGAMDRALGKLYPTAKQGAGAMREMVEEGRVTAEVFRDVTIKALQEYSGAAEKTAGNISAVTARMKNAWNDLLNTIGQQIATPLTSVMEGMIRLIQSVENGISRLASIGSTLKTSFDWMNPMDSVGAAWEKAVAANPTPGAQVQGPPVAPPPAPKAAVLAPAEPKAAKRTVGDRYAEQKREMEEQIAAQRELADAYEYGRPGVERYQAALTDLSDRQRLNSGYSKAQAEALHGLMTQLKEVQKVIALKESLGSMEEAIQKARGLAEAHAEGAAAVRGVEAATEAYSDAVRLGMTNNQEAIAQLYEMRKAVQQAESSLALAETLSDMDIDIAAFERLSVAFLEGGNSAREAAIANEVYARSIQLGIDGDEAQVTALREKVRALYDVQDATEESRRVMDAGFDIAQGQAELDMLSLVGEARMIEAERLSMLMDKKRQLQDTTATLTAEEEAQADALGRLAYQSALANDALSLMARSSMSFEQSMRNAVAGGLGHFEDALVDIITGAKSAREAFADMARSIAQDLARMAIRMAIIQPLAAMFGGFGGNVAMMGGGMMMSQRHTGGVIGVDPAPMRRIAAFHTGGIVGHETPSMRSLPPISSWTKYHTGGLAGNEVPAVLQKGEGVFTKGQMASLAPAGSGGSTNNITVNVAQNPNGSDPGAAERQGRIIAQQIKQAVDERLIQARRPGGINNPTGY